MAISKFSSLFRNKNPLLNKTPQPIPSNSNKKGSVMFDENYGGIISGKTESSLYYEFSDGLSYFDMENGNSYFYDVFGAIYKWHVNYINKLKNR